MKPSPFITCCGMAHGTNFCPNCGKQLRTLGNIKSLLVHLRENCDRAKRRLEFQIECAAEEPKGEPKEVVALQEVKRIEKTYNKWKGWVEAVEELIAIDEIVEDCTPSQETPQ